MRGCADTLGLYTHGLFAPPLNHPVRDPGRQRNKKWKAAPPHPRSSAALGDWAMWGLYQSQYYASSRVYAPGSVLHLTNTLPGRAMALTTTLIDQLIPGDPKVASHVPGAVSFAHQVDPVARSRCEQIAPYFFMLSHFVADSCQPNHCDARKLSGYSNGVHKELKAHWNKTVGTYFDKKKLMASSDTAYKVLKTAKAVDQEFGISFSNSVPDLVAGDTWLEMMFVCRAGFAIASIIANPTDFSYSSKKLTKFKDVFDPAVVPELLEDLDKVVMHDAVLNTAIVRKGVWATFE